AVAAAHARLAARRPQGRALVSVRPAGADAAAFDPSRAVIDLVTDDMPFLVSSVLMELRRQDLDAPLIVHPQLAARRDVTGNLREVCGAVGGGQRPADAIAESWIHIEAEGLAPEQAPELAERLRRLLD